MTPHGAELRRDESIVLFGRCCIRQVPIARPIAKSDGVSHVSHQNPIIGRIAFGSGPRISPDGPGYSSTQSMQGPRSSQNDMHIPQHCYCFLFPFETSWGFGAELKRSQCHDLVGLGETLFGMFVAVCRNKSRAATHGSWFAQPCDPLIMVCAQGTAPPGDSLDHARQRVGPLKIPQPWSCQPRGTD